MCGALLADGAEQEAGEPAETTGADDEEVGVGGLLDQHARGVTFADARVERELLRVASQLLDRSSGGRSGGLLELMRIESGSRAANSSAARACGDPSKPTTIVPIQLLDASFRYAT